MGHRPLCLPARARLHWDAKRSTLAPMHRRSKHHDASLFETFHAARPSVTPHMLLDARESQNSLLRIAGSLLNNQWTITYWSLKRARTLLRNGARISLDITAKKAWKSWRPAIVRASLVRTAIGPTDRSTAAIKSRSTMAKLGQYVSQPLVV